MEGKNQLQNSIKPAKKFVWENRNLRAVVWQEMLTRNDKGRERRKGKLG
jgi:hypothetical protein